MNRWISAEVTRREAPNGSRWRLTSAAAPVRRHKLNEVAAPQLGMSSPLKLAAESTCEEFLYPVSRPQCLGLQVLATWIPL